MRIRLLNLFVKERDYFSVIFLFKAVVIIHLKIDLFMKIKANTEKRTETHSES